MNDTLKKQITTLGGDSIDPEARARFHLAAIVDSADDAVVSKDLNGIVASWNEAAHRMFGYSTDEMIGQSILRIIPKDLQYEEDEILSKIRAGERIQHFETKRITKGGEILEVSVTISPIKDDSGRVIGASKIARDISDRKRMEQLLIESEKLAATGRMAATIAHEINNPLEALLNLIYLARQSCGQVGKTHEFLLTAEHELERVSHIARQTLDYYRNTAAADEIDLHCIIEDVLIVYRSKLESQGISVVSHFADVQKISVLKGDMIQVFSNIVANSIDAMPQGGQIHISTDAAHDLARKGIQIVIRDEGTGIPEQHVADIFEPFFTTKGRLGTGIGLWVAKQLIEKRGGEIGVASNTKAENNGTEVTIFLPFDARASDMPKRRL